MVELEPTNGRCVLFLADLNTNPLLMDYCPMKSRIVTKGR